jgi:enolase
MRMPKITDLRVRRILDSRGNPTIEVEIETEAGWVRAAAPSGASRGKNEAVAFPEGGVKASIEILKEQVFPKLKGREVERHEEIDRLLRELDGSPDFSKIGGNAAVAVSMAVAKAASLASGLPLYKYLNPRASSLPFPLGNVIGGGAHAGKTTPDIQEFHVLPTGAKSFSQAAFANAKVHKKLKGLIEKKDQLFAGGKGDEGAWAARLTSEEALELLAEAARQVEEEEGIKISLGLDLAASGLWDGKSYRYSREGKVRDSGEQLDFLVGLVEKYRLLFLEDPLHEEDFEGFAELTRKVGEKCIVCGDDLYVTNPSRIRKGMEMKASNAVLIKPNQVGTLTETLQAVELTKRAGCVPVISHRSGETPDETISHLAVGWGCPIIKTGAVGGERVAKLNELIRIEEELGERARMAELKWSS